MDYCLFFCQIYTFTTIHQLPRSHFFPLANSISAGQLLCGGLFSVDSLSNWCAAVALAHSLQDNLTQKEQLLRVQLATSLGKPPVSLLQQCTNILSQVGRWEFQLAARMRIFTGHVCLGRQDVFGKLILKCQQQWLEQCHVIVDLQGDKIVRRVSNACCECLGGTSAGYFGLASEVDVLLAHMFGDLASLFNSLLTPLSS